MTLDAVFDGWNWEDPEVLSGKLADFRETFSRCDALERIADKIPRTRVDLIHAGITGIEFASRRTKHPTGLGSDLVGPHMADTRMADSGTEPGYLYLVDGQSRFAELDISEPLPFDAESLDWVYAEHLIGMVSVPIAISWLTEVRRVLAPGGLLRLTTPDLRKYAEGYVNDEGFLAKHQQRLKKMRVGPAMPERRAFMFNQIFFLFEHRWMYDLDELRYVLSEAGFDPAAMVECSYREGSRDDVANLDTILRTDETLYIETRKAAP